MLKNCGWVGWGGMEFMWVAYKILVTAQSPNYSFLQDFSVSPSPLGLIGSLNLLWLGLV